MNTLSMRLSTCLSALLLLLTGLLLALSMLLGTLGNWEHPSYLFALLLGGLCALGAHRLRRALCGRLSRDKNGRSLVPCLCLALLCLALHLAWVLLFRMEPENDYATFYAAAEDLANGRPLRGAEYLALFPHILGYASFLGLAFRLFGASPLTAAVLNALLTTVSGVLLYLLCLRWRDREAAAWAFVLWILCPSKLLYNAMVLSEPFYTCLILLFLFLISQLCRSEGLTATLLLAALCALALRAIQVSRPIAAVLLIALAIWLLLLRGTWADAKRWCCFAAALLAVYFVTGQLWHAYALRVLGEEPAAVPGYSIYVGFNEDSGGAYATEDAQLLMRYRYERCESADEAQREMLQEAKARIYFGRINFARLFSAKLKTFLGNDEAGAYYAKNALHGRSYQVWCVLSNAYYYMLLMLSLCALGCLLRERRQDSLLLVPLFILGLSLAQMLVEVAGRYHYSLVPALILLAPFSVRESGIEKLRR